MDVTDISSLDTIIAAIAAERDPAARRARFLETFRILEPAPPAERLRLVRGVQEAMKKWRDKPGMAYTLWGEGVCLNALNKFSEGEKNLRRALAMFEKLGDRVGMMKALRHISNACKGLARFAEGREAAKRGLEIARELGNRREEAFLLRNLGACWHNLGEVSETLRCFLDSMVIFQELGERIWEGRVIASIGVAYTGIGDIETALKYHLRALEVLRECPPDDELALLLTNLGILYYHYQQIDQAIESVTKGVEMYRVTGNYEFEASSHGVLGFLYGEKDDLPNASIHLDEALRLMEMVDASNDLIEPLRSAGLVYLKFGEYAKALQCFRRGLERAEQSGAPKLIYLLHRGMVRAYKGLGELALAIEHFEIAEELREKFMETDMRAILDEMQAKFDVAQAEREKEVALLRAENLERQIDHRTRELAALELNLNGREELLNQLQERLQNSLAKKSDQPLTILRDMLREIESQRNAPHSYSTYVSKIDQMQENFNRVLMERFPRLTPSELKICSLMRGTMSTKEIADLLSVTTRNVETHRYHIRQKMRLPKETNLAIFLSSL